jgi:hypothetical protein
MMFLKRKFIFNNNIKMLNYNLAIFKNSFKNLMEKFLNWILK